jgi:hypothetical protein
MTNWDVVHDLRDKIVLLQEALHQSERKNKILQIKIGKKNEELELLKGTSNEDLLTQLERSIELTRRIEQK